MRPAGSPQDLERRRQRAIVLLQEGHSPKEVSERVGVDRPALDRRLPKRGRKDRQAPGRPPKLVPSQKQYLVDLLPRGSKVAGFSTVLWTCERVAQFIQDRFGVVYHPDHEEPPCQPVSGHGRGSPSLHPSPHPGLTGTRRPASLFSSAQPPFFAGNRTLLMHLSITSRKACRLLTFSGQEPLKFKANLPKMLLGFKIPES